jgi:hypothetical protein
VVTSESPAGIEPSTYSYLFITSEATDLSTAVQVWLVTWLVAAKGSARVQSCPERSLATALARSSPTATPAPAKP